DLPPSRHAANVETFNAILKALIENPACSIQNIEKRMHGTYIGLASATGSDGSANFESAENRAKRSGIFSAALDSINNKENKLVTVMIGDTVYVCKGTDKITLSNGQTISLYDFATNKTSGGTMAVPDSDFESVIKQKAVAVIVETEADRIKLLNPTPAAPTAGAGAAIASPAPRAA
ncbi:MAG: hypothetical protein EB121_03365, partial [Alphaproteobacteria bacterium]|nr:hypothetical protein [Alphaproteobacteria bacterium]